MPEETEVDSRYLLQFPTMYAVSSSDNPPLVDDGASAKMFISCLNTHQPRELTHLSLLPLYDSGVLRPCLKNGPFTTFWRNGSRREGKHLVRRLLSSYHYAHPRCKETKAGPGKCPRCTTKPTDAVFRCTEPGAWARGVGSVPHQHCGLRQAASPSFCLRSSERNQRMVFVQHQLWSGRQSNTPQKIPISYWTLS